MQARKYYYSPNPEIESKILLLLEVGACPLPVAPIQPRQEKDFTGKNPSYLNIYGGPVTVYHTQYQERSPSPEELKRFFANPRVGIGTLGGFQGVHWIDLDRKDYLLVPEEKATTKDWRVAQEDCDADGERIVKLAGAGWIERTGGGGWRIPIRLENKPGFTDFTTVEGGLKRGQLIGWGRFVVLAPTVHPNGSQYRAVQYGEIPWVKNLADIGIYPHREQKKTSKRTTKREPTEAPAPATEYDTAITQLCLKLMKPERYDDRDSWLRIGMATHSLGDDSLLADWNHYSQQSSKWEPGCCERAWQSFSQDGGITIATLIDWASRDNPEQFKKESWLLRNTEIQRQLNSLTEEPTLRLNQRYLVGLELPQPGSVVFIDSAMGTGKTQLIGYWMKEFFKRSPGGKIRLLSYRNGLLRQTCNKFGIQLIHDLATDGKKNNKHINHQTAVAACVDSLLRFDLKELAGAMVVIDEVDATLRHLLQGGTCQKNRPKLLIQLGEILRRVVETGGIVVAMEASLTDLPIDIMRNLVPEETKVNLIVNEHKPTSWDVQVGSGSASGLTNLIADSYYQGEKIVLATDSQRYAETLERQIRELCPEIKIIRVDGKTTEETDIKEFLAHPNEVLAKEKPDLLLFTPSMESGADITVDYFNRMLFKFSHLETRVQMQMLGRIRQPIPRVGFCSEFAERDENYRSLNPETLMRDVDKLMTSKEGEKLFWEILQEMVRDRHPEFGEVAYDVLPERIRERARAFTSTTFGIARRLGTSYQNQESESELWLEYWSKFHARTNGSKVKLRQNLVEALKAAGHQVTEVAIAKDEEATRLKKKYEKQILEETTRKFVEVETGGMNSTEAYQVLNSHTSTEEERFRAQKVMWQEWLPGAEFTFDFVLKAIVEDHGLFYRQTRRLWGMSHPDVILDLDRKELRYQLTDTPFLYLPDLRHEHSKVELLQQLIGKLIVADREFSPDDADIQRLKKCALDRRFEIRAELGLNITEKQTGIDILSKLLKKIGYELQGRRIRTQDTRSYLYQIADFDNPHRLTILKALDKKHLTKTRRFF